MNNKSDVIRNEINTILNRYLTDVSPNCDYGDHWAIPAHNLDDLLNDIMIELQELLQ